MEGLDENGDPTPIEDRWAAELAAAARAEAATPGAFLDVRPVFGDLGENPRLREAYIGFRQAIAERGVRTAIAEIAAD